jgi:hypothetical protein
MEKGQKWRESGRKVEGDNASKPLDSKKGGGSGRRFHYML